jgi:hypothetical protein
MLVIGCRFGYSTEMPRRSDMSLDHAYANDVAPVALEPTAPIAFITSPATADTSVIREALRHRGYTPLQLDEIPAAGRSILALLRESIARADLVVAVIGDEAASSSVFLEIGFAQAMDKRILALAPLGDSPRFEGIAYLRAEPTNREAVEFGLDRVLEAPKEGPHVEEAAERTRPIGDLADELLAEYWKARGELGELDSMVWSVIRALETSGLRARSTSVQPEIGMEVEFAVWVDDLDPWMENPLLVVIRRELNDEKNLSQVASRLSHSSLPKASWGLILCGKLGIEPVQARATPNVFAVSLEEFLEALRVEGFGAYLSRLRIERIHAKG